VHVRNARLLAPLVALVALAILAIVLAAQAGLSFCSHRIAIAAPGDMAGMPGMAMGSMPGMPRDHQLMICPVVLTLIVASAILAAAATIVLCRGAESAFTRRAIARVLVRLPVVPAVLVLALFSAIAVGAMIALDGAGVPDALTCLLMAALMLGGASVAVAVAVLSARVVLALGRQLFVAIVAAIGDRAPAANAFALRWTAPPIAGPSTCLVGAGRGLRAPPSFVR
jgi:hypothetical protein